MKGNIVIPGSSWSLILIMALGILIVEAAEVMLRPKIRGVNELYILIIDVLLPTIIIAPLLLWLLKSRNRFEIALKESEEQFRTLFESSPDAIFLADPETGIIIGANSKASELTARAHEEIIGMHQSQLHPPRTEEDVRKAFKERVRKGKQKYPVEYSLLRSDGTEVPVEAIAQMVTIKGKYVLQGVFRDITDRKKVEKEKERLINAINRSTEGIALADEEDRFIYVNAAYAGIYGCSQEELIGDTWRKISPPEIIATTEKGLSETLHNRDVGVFRGEVPGLFKDGTMIPTDVSATGFWDSDGKYQGHVCIVKDITERKNTEKRLEESFKQVKEEKAKTQSIIAAIGDAISVQDTDFKILYQNKIHQDIMGDQKGRYCYREYENRDHICEGCPLKQTFTDGKIHTEERNIIKNKMELCYEITASPLRDSTGNIIAGIEVARNITERKQIERKLQDEEHFMESIFTSIQDGIGIIDKDMNILKVNQTAKSWYPHISTFVGRKCFEAYHGRSERCEICPAKRTFETGESAHELVPKHGIGGTKVGWLEIYSYPMIDTSTGEMKGVIEYVRDISERKKAEEELLMFKLGIERSDESIFVTTIDGSIIYVNPAFEKTYGYSREEALGKTPRIIKSGMLPSEAYKPFWDTLLSKKVISGELVNKTKDGRLINIGGSVNPILNTEGNIIGFLAIQRDITGAKQADELLKKNISMLEKAQEIGQMGNWEWDIATNEVVWSDQVYKLYGLDPSKDNIDYDVVVDTMTSETREWFLKAIDDALKHGMPFDGEYGLFRPDGTIRYTHTRGEVIRDKEGNPVKMFGMVQDITERKQAEKALRESNDFSEKLIDSLRDGLSVLNKDGVRFKVNKALCDMIGSTKDELINGKPPFSFWPPEHMKEIQESFETMIQGNLDEKEMVFMRTSGERFPVLISASYMRDEHGRITNLINSIKDITERKRIEDELKSSKEFSETVLDSMNHEITIINVSDFSIVDANRAVIEKSKLKKEELIGKKCYEMIHRQNTPCTFPENICPVAETKMTGKYSMAEHIHYNKDGESRYIEVSTSPIKNKKGEVIQVVHISKDITERKLAEKQIIASLNEKEVLLREIHHRVKNNMQIVSSLLWLQAEHIRDENDLEIFKDSQNRIMSMSLVHEKLYRSEDLAGIDINEYITDLTNNLFQSYGIRKSTIDIKINVGNVSLGIDSSIPCGLIINELVTNSLKYAFPDSRKGEIRVSLRNLNENKLELTVGDNGVGIPEYVNFRKTESLGLRLVTILTENQLHGEINLDRSRGTEFKIKFKGVK